LVISSLHLFYNLNRFKNTIGGSSAAAALSAVSGATADEAFVGEISAVAFVGEDHVLTPQSLQLVVTQNVSLIYLENAHFCRRSALSPHVREID
jgi:hypothetical protein